MTWAQDQRIAWIKDRLENGEQVNRSDIVEKFIITKQTATATMHKFRERHPGAVVYDGKSKAFWAPGKSPATIDWKARALAAEAQLAAPQPLPVEVERERIAQAVCAAGRKLTREALLALGDALVDDELPGGSLFIADAILTAHPALGGGES